MTTTTEDVQRLEAEAEQSAALARQAREQAAAAARAADAERDRRAREHARQQVEAYAAERADLVEQERLRHRAFASALLDTPLVEAYIDWQTAKLWTVRRAQLNNYDRSAAGLPQQEVSALPYSVPAFAEVVGAAIGETVVDRLAVLEQVHGEAQQQAVYGDALALTPEQHAARGAHEVERQRLARAVMGGATVDVSLMTDAEREAAGVPTGSSRPEHSR